MARVRIIGTGAVGAPGYGVSAGIDAVLDGRDCLTPLSLFDAQLKEIPLVGEVKEDPASRLDIAPPNRTAALALCALREATGSLSIPTDLRLGLVFSTTVAGITESELFYKSFRIDKSDTANASRILKYHEPGTNAAWLARAVGACGVHSISTACSTGLHAVGMAKRLIDNGTYDCCVAVGSDALSMLTIRGFASLMLVDFSGCKPCDRRRVGICLGEGAGAILLASDNTAERLGALTKGYVCGWGATADAHHMTAPHPEGDGARRATLAGLSEAGIVPSDIGFIAGHATATPDNDVAEAKAMRAVFGDVMPPFCSMKRSLGHTLAASGTLEAVYALDALNRSVVPATGGFEEYDERVGFSPSTRHEKNMRYAIKNAFGFGGNNASIVLERGDA